MSNWSARLKTKMKEFGFTQEELAQKLGVTRSAVAHYVQGTRQPPLHQVIKLAAIFKTDPAWLQFGKTQESKHSQKLKPQYQIPILDWHQAIHFKTLATSSIKNYLDIFNCSHINCFALKIKSDAMTSPLGQSVSFQQGTYIIIDPNKSVKHGDFVLVSATNKQEAIFRQYIEEAGVSYLKPLNSQYPLMQLERNTKILGIVIANINFI